MTPISEQPILLVEDNVGDVFLLREALNDSGLRFRELHVAHDLTQARSMLKENDPWIILLDLSLPDSTDQETFKAMQAAAPQIPIIVLSGLEKMELALDTVKMGAQDYLIKGEFDERILEKAINYAVERNRQMADTKRNMERYRLLFDHNPTPMWAVEQETMKFLMVNDAAIKHYGYSREEFLNMTALDIRPKKDHQAFIDRQRHSRENKQHDFGEWRHICKNGKIIDVAIHLDHITLEGRNADLIIVHDITARKKEEQHLRLLESVVQNTRDSIVITEAEPKNGPGPRIVFTNPAFTAHTGYTKEDVIGKTPRILQGADTDRKELDRVRKALEAWEPVEAELINYDKAGKPFWVEFSIFPVANEKGWYTNWISVQRDITEKKQSELELRQLNRDLDEKVKVRTAELSRTNSELTYINTQITDSIRYAKRIQQAILPRPKLIQEHFHDAFCLNMPKDLLSGDFYWQHSEGDRQWIAVADCTGHGVPGAMMSIIGHDLFNRAVMEHRLMDAGSILDHVDLGLDRILRQGQEFAHIQDGMDVALCMIDKARKKLSFAGALRPLFIIAEGKTEVQEISGTRSAVGPRSGDRVRFNTTELDLRTGDRIFLTSDGFYSQFGGREGKKMLKRRWTEMVQELDANLPMNKQGELLTQAFNGWKGSHEQVDDVLVVGIRL